MLCNRFSIIVTLIFLQATTGSAGEPVCEYEILRELIEGKSHEIRQISPTARQGNIRIKSVLGTREKIIFGFTRSHAYLFADGVRYHGKVSYLREGPRLILTGKSSLKGGIWYVFDDVEPELVSRLRRHLESQADIEKKTVSCVTGACTELKAATGIRPAGLSLPFPTALVSRILKGGFVDQAGKPVKATIYRTNALKFEDIQKSFDSIESEILPLVGFVGGAVFLGVTVGGVVLWDKFFSGEDVENE